MTLVSGYLTNVTVISHIMGSRGVILLDELSHNSIISGCKATPAEVVFFRHNDLGHLDELLTEKRLHHKTMLIVSESLFSMDGDIVDLPRLIELKKKHGAWLLLDEAHSIGVLGQEGRGLCEHTGVDPNEVGPHHRDALEELRLVRRVHLRQIIGDQLVPSYAARLRLFRRTLSGDQCRGSGRRGDRPSRNLEN